ncbi:MAG: hypothetical protein Q27BB25_14790 [Blastomonas sp. CACIA14H2]|nr:MAG: hypothetical protein Q27BB25_14790 [Blastomonas sp. CACIA14H2]
MGMIMGRPISRPELADERLRMRVRNLPTQLERARARVRQLEQQARDWKLHDLIQDQAQ